ncbi:MAG: ABC transporter substrate-binding protein [Actinobacteria bacterium]|nr:ABC transporter substrate-binding protein [Actinomycetota bacterium]
MKGKAKIVIAASAVLLLLTTFVFSGCKEEQAEDLQNTSIEVVDGEGNIIALDRPVERIIVLAPSILEIADGLGVMEKIIEVDNFSVMAGEALAAGFEGVGDNQSLNVERIAELDPDILIAITGGPEDDYNKVRELGIPVYRVINVMGMDGVYQEILNISKITGKEERGLELIGDLRSQVEDISSKVEGLTDDQRPAVFYEIWNEPLMSAGADTFINDLIEIAGGKNILSEDGLTGWVEYSIETLIEKDPDVIIVPLSLVTDPLSLEVDPSIILEDPRFASINAVIDGDVYIVPDNPVSRPSQNIIKGLQMLARAIHPEIFGEFEIIE